MKLKGSGLFWTFIWCWFMGVTAISIGFGALFPSMNLVAKPFVCPSGKMDLTKEVYNPYPGNTITTITWYCMDEASGAKKEVAIFPMSLYAGTIYGWIFFGLVVISMQIIASRRSNTANEMDRASMDLPNTFVYEPDPLLGSTRLRQDDLEHSHKKLKVVEDALSRMKELKELRAANMISETEYEEKRAEILKGL